MKKNYLHSIINEKGFISNWAGLCMVLILSFTFGAVVGTGLYFLFNPFKVKTPQIITESLLTTPPATPTLPAAQDPTFRWELYTQGQYGYFSVKYPKDLLSVSPNTAVPGTCNKDTERFLTLTTLAPTASPSAELLTREGLADVSIYVRTNQSTVSGDNWVEKICPEILRSTNGQKNPLRVDNVPAIQYSNDTEKNTITKADYYVFILRNNTLFTIEGHFQLPPNGTQEGLKTPDDFRTLFANMIKTFKFTQ